MTVFADRKAALMAYCRIDELEPGEDSLLEGLYHAAVSYMAGAGVKEPEAGSLRQALYDLCVDHLVLEAYDHRGPVEGAAENPAFRRMLNQLKMSG